MFHNGRKDAPLGFVFFYHLPDLNGITGFQRFHRKHYLVFEYRELASGIAVI
jgi:hypothetical protein